MFYSFDFDEDVFRVSQIKQIGALTNETIVSANEWETLKRRGDTAIANWITLSMQQRSCVIVLIGEKTSNSRWVRFEIELASRKRIPLLGVFIHNLKCPRNGTSRKGKNPFELIVDSHGSLLSHSIQCHEPHPLNPNKDIQEKLPGWIESAISN